jgi:hypothetical protein
LGIPTLGEAGLRALIGAPAKDMPATNQQLSLGL